MVTKLRFMALLVCLSSFGVIHAQTTTTTTTSTNSSLEENQDYNDTWKTPIISDDMTVDEEQNKSWRMGEYKFSSKPKNSWEFGIHFGHFFIDGDIDRDIPGGYGLGLHLRKAVNYIFSIRGSIFYGMASGTDNQPWRHRNASGIGGGLVESTFDMYDPLRGGPGEWFPAHQTRLISGDLAAVLNIGNLLFHKERNKWNIYMALGLGLSTHEARLDLLDNNGLPYANVRETIGWTREEFNTKAGRDRIESELQNLYDGDYETEGFQKEGIFRLGDDMNIHVVFVPSVGISRKINKRFNIGIEHQVFLSDNDYLDGLKFRTALDQTNNVDIGHYTNVRIGLNIGNFKKVTEPLYWMNPIDQAYNELSNVKNQATLDLTDEDNDGVLDIIDMELNSKEDCPVDTRGILLDSDGDGIVDCEDREPYSRPGCEIDEFGVAQCEEEQLTNEQEVNELIDSKLEAFKTEYGFSSTINGENPNGNGLVGAGENTTGGSTGSTEGGSTTEVNNTTGGNNNTAGGTNASGSTGSDTSAGGVAGAGGTNSGGTVTRVITNPDGTTRVVTVPAGAGTIVNSGCGNWFLPMIHYDLNKYTIKPEYYSHIHNVAQVMKKCPEVCVTAQGHTDSRNSNAYNNVLSFKRAKAAVDYLTENYGIDRSRIKLMYGGEDNPMIKAPSNEAHHFMNRRVEFRTCEVDDYDMEAPEGYKKSNSATKSQFYQGNKSSGY